MQRIFIDNHDRILYYSNPAGYIAEKEAVVDTMFQTQELERFLQKQAIPIRWEDGVYDRLLLGQQRSLCCDQASQQTVRSKPQALRHLPGSCQEILGTFHDDSQFFEVLRMERSHAPSRQDASGGNHTYAGNA